MSSNPWLRANPDFSKLYVFGAGGSGREVAWLAEQVWSSRVAVEFVVDRPNLGANEVNGLRVRSLASIAPDATARFVVAIGDPVDRRRVVALCRMASLRETLLIHPRAELSSRVAIGQGTVVCAGVVVTTDIRLGEHVHINIGCTISHDAIIGDYVTLSPGVHVSGHVHIRDGAFVGTGANIINGSTDAPLVIGEGAVVAAGACVIKSVDAKALVAGVPAVRKR
jgi:sugar O-acyltransferase (sialic acid O-acetyltransferase NeuD family)